MFYTELSDIPETGYKCLINVSKRLSETFRRFYFWDSNSNAIGDIVITVVVHIVLCLHFTLITQFAFSRQPQTVQRSADPLLDN